MRRRRPYAKLERFINFPGRMGWNSDLFLMNVDFEAVRESARTAEELGYHLVVFPDHFVHQAPGGGYDPHSLAHDAILLAAAAAQATRTIRIGHVVLCNLFRHPAGDGAGADVARPSERRAPARRPGRRMDRDRVPDDRNRFSGNRHAPADARRVADLHPLAVDSGAHDLRGRVLSAKGCDSVAQAAPAASSAYHHRRQRSRSAAPDG